MSRQQINQTYYLKNQEKLKARQRKLDQFEKLSNRCLSIILDLGMKEKGDLAKGDYEKIRNLKKKLNELEKDKFLQDPNIQAEITDLKNSLQDLAKGKYGKSGLLPINDQSRNDDNDPNNNDKGNKNQQEREREQLNQDIQNLENKPNKTAEEEQELARKKKSLAELDNQNKNNSESQNNQGENNLGTYFALGAVVCLVLGLGYLLSKRNKKHKHAKK